MRKPLLTQISANLRSKTSKIWVLLLAFLLSNGILFSQCDPDINGEAYQCGNDIVLYSFSGGNTIGVLPVWSLSGGGNIQGNNLGIFLQVEWTTPGNHQVYLEIPSNIACPAGQFDTLDVTVVPTFAPELACNDTVQVSLGLNCEALVTVDMILEGSYSDPDEVFDVYVIDENGDTVPNDLLNGDHVDMYFDVTVVHRCSGNYCEGVLLVEDKLPPEDLVCSNYIVECDDNLTPNGGPTNFPLPQGTTVFRHPDPNTYLVRGLDACSDVILSYRDVIVADTCPFVNTIYRIWTATDASGTSLTCTDTIRVNAGNIMNITWPEDFDGNGGNPGPIDACSNLWPRDINGHPDTSYTGSPIVGAICSNIDVSYSDLRLEICENSYKLLREWIAVDWCNDTIAYHTQIIKVLDERGPIISCRTSSGAPDTIYTIPGTCLGSKVLPVPERNPFADVFIIAECSEWTYSVKYKPAENPEDCTPVPGEGEYDPAHLRIIGYTPDRRPIFEAYDLPTGCNWIYYVITDACGNVTECQFDIYVKEHENPIAVCDLHTVVTLSDAGTAKVYAETFDDGSHDNCQLGYFKVRRMDPNDCTDTEFRDYVEFCCEDVANNPIMVVLRVYDASGNYSECMVEVTVQDKTPPVLVCPPRITVSCEYDLSDLSVFGDVVTDPSQRQNIIINDPHNTVHSQPRNWGLDGYASDDCDITLDYSERIFSNDCGVQSVHRTWTLNKGTSTERLCTQVITVRNFSPGDFTGLKWPDHKDLTNGCPDHVDPAETGEPEISDDNCSLYLINYDDEVYNIVQNACFKVLRTWTVHDHCSNLDTSFVQVIKILNTEPPIITSPCTDISVNAEGSDCEAYVELITEAVDSCTANGNLEWSYRIDLDSDGDINITGFGNDASDVYQAGRHRIYWTVEDRCGNTTSCNYYFTVVDRKKPTPYCLAGLITVVMQNTGTVVVWASDFDAGSFDNCSDNEDLTFSFNQSGNQQSRIFRCSDIEDGRADTIMVQIWVIDEAGNRDYCETQIILQDNRNDVCPNVSNGQTGTIAGLVQTPDDKMVSEVNVMLDNSAPSMPQYDLTTDDGHYAFPSIPLKEDYLIDPSKNDDAMNGVSTRDILYIQRHLLGISSFNNPYQYIAADVNGSEHVSTSDITELRKLILGVYSQLPNNESWRFINANYQFADPNDPFPFEEVDEIKSLDGDDMATDFIAVKIGDLSGDVVTNSIISTEGRSGDEMVLFVTVPESVDEPLVELPFYADAFTNMLGLQFTLRFDAASFELNDISYGLPQMNESHFGLHRIEDGIITMSWNSLMPLTWSSDSPLFSLKLVRKESGASIENALRINSEITKAEAFDESEDDMSIKLEWRSEKGEVMTGQAFELLQNRPNPFDKSTVVGFVLPENDNIALTILDVTGKVVKQIEGYYPKGYNEIRISVEDLQMTGILYYQLETEDHTAHEENDLDRLKLGIVEGGYRLIQAGILPSKDKLTPRFIS